MWILLVILKTCSGLLIEGDVAVPRSSSGDKVSNSFVSDPSQLWTNGIVPYLFETLQLENGMEEPTFSEEHMQMIKKAMAHISEQVPCIKFRMGDGGDNDPARCWAYVGCQGAQGGKRGQTINLGSSGCFNTGTVLHEIMHSLGASHEHNREDRDRYIDILEENILEEGDKNFQKRETLYSSFGTPYDYASIMHYASDAFAVPGTKTIVPLQQDITLIPESRKSRLSPIDSMELANVYGNLTQQNCHIKNQCCPSTGFPTAPRIILLGETGVGKSTIGNRLFGKKPGKCSSPNSKLDPANPVFGVGYDMDSHTNETAWISGKWLGIESNPCVTILDTPGIGDSMGRDCQHANQIAQLANEMGEIHTFLLVVKGTDNKFSQYLRAQLNLYEEMFGRKFWLNLAIEVNWWGHDKRSRKIRKIGRKIDEAKYANQWNDKLSKEFYITNTIPVVFVDPMVECEEGKNETVIFKEETSKLWNYVDTNKPFMCDEESCKGSGLNPGVPLLVTDGPIGLRVEGKVALTWNIWFGECGNQKGIRSYEVMFTDSLGITSIVFSRTDNQTVGKDGNLANNPSNASVEEKCSKNTIDDLCDNSNSKYMTVTLTFNKIHADDFGNYLLINTLGRSKEVEIRKVVDQPSEYSEWSEWTCKETCYNPYRRDLNREVRTRKCIPNDLNNCETMTDTWEESKSHCTSITKCPALRELEVRVCNPTWSGTDDYVKIKFKNGENEQCSTDWLDKEGDDFQTGSEQKWDNAKYDFLSSCSKVFRPTDGLYVMIEVDTLLINCHSDDLQICRVWAAFGDEDEIGSSTWRWSAGYQSGKWNNKMYGCYLTYVSNDQKVESIYDKSEDTLNTIGWLPMCKKCAVAERKTNKYCCKE